MCHPRRDEPELIPRQDYIEPLSDESDIDDEEIPETDDDSNDESEDTEDTCIEESDETDDESEDIDVTSSEEFHVPEASSSYDNFNSEENARGRRLGHVSARRAQSPRNELSPSSSGVTFNGFTQNLVPEEITDHRIVSPTEMWLSVRWRNHPETCLIELSVMREHRPDMVVDYLRAMVARLPDNHFPSVYRNE